MTFSKPIHYGVPEIDVLVASAARSESGDVLVLKVVNFAPFAMKTKINIAGMAQVRTQSENGSAHRRRSEVGEHCRPAQPDRAGHRHARWHRPGLPPRLSGVFLHNP